MRRIDAPSHDCEVEAETGPIFFVCGHVQNSLPSVWFSHNVSKRQTAGCCAGSMGGPGRRKGLPSAPGIFQMSTDFDVEELEFSDYGRGSGRLALLSYVVSMASGAVFWWIVGRAIIGALS